MKAQVNEALIDDRPGFEKFAGKQLDISRDAEGEYISETVKLLWLGWTAGRWNMFKTVNEEMKKRK